MPDLAGAAVDMPANPRRVHRHRHMVREAHGLTPDGARLAMYDGKVREATCICGCKYSKHEHIWLTCEHHAVAQVRTQWKDEIKDMLYENGGGHCALYTELTHLWEIRSDGLIPGAWEAERRAFTASWMWTKEDGMDRDSEGMTDEDAPDEDAEYAFDEEETDEQNPLPPEVVAAAHVLTGNNDERDHFDPNWNGMAAAVDKPR